MKILVFDFGPNLGDNFRGFLFLKSLKGKHPEIRLTCWITPELQQNLASLAEDFGFIDQFLVHPRPPRQTYDLNFRLVKQVLEAGQEFTLEHFPPGLGPDGKDYDKIVPTSEVWFTAKLLAGEALAGLEPMNQGEFLGRMLGLSPDEVGAALPLFGRRAAVRNYICLGLCRPSPKDRKQPARSRIDLVWEKVLNWGGEVLALDYQDWYSLPQAPQVKDWRLQSWGAKVPLLNQARLFIGLDGGLNHFAAACGCPTFSFFGQSRDYDPGLLVGPYPRRTRFGRHRWFNDFEGFLRGIEVELARLPAPG